MPKVLDDRTAAVVDALCEAIVPGSARVGPGVYVDAVLARMGGAERRAALAAIDTLAEPVASGPEALAERARTPEFLQVRALVIEAYYSDFVERSARASMSVSVASDQAEAAGHDGVAGLHVADSLPGADRAPSGHLRSWSLGSALRTGTAACRSAASPSGAR